MNLLAGLDPAQVAAVTTEAQPLCIVAGAGSGKTRVLTARIAHRVAVGTADASHVLALTFTRKAAGELRQRLRGLGVRDSVAAGTFHAVAWTELRRRWADQGQRPPVLLDRPVRLLAQLVDRAAAPALAAEVGWAKARLIRPDAYEQSASDAGRHPGPALAEVAEAYRRYEAEKRRRVVVDFDDLLLLAADALEQDEAFAAGQRWRFRHLFVDELQDVNAAQLRLLRAWLGGRTDLCAVGDPRQAVYGWNGADPGLLDHFPQLFPGSTVLHLATNHRSTPEIVAAADAVLGQPGATAASRGPGPDPQVWAFPTAADEAVEVARLVRRAHRPGTPWSAIAVLARTNAQLEPLAAALRAVGIPYRTPALRFADQPAVRAALDLLRRGSARPDRSGALGWAAPGSLARAVPDLDELSDEQPTDDDAGLVATVAGLARDHLAVDPRASVDGFVIWLDATLRDEAPPVGSDAVEVTTFHRAKGLQWPAVIVTGLEDGLVPHWASPTPAARAEERRLLHVALTRAEDELHCTWAADRPDGGRARTARAPSPWLPAIVAPSAQAANRPGGDGDWRQHLAASRAALTQRAS